MSRRRLLSAWLPVLAVQCLILALSARPNVQIPTHIRHLDKVAHFMEYAALGALFYRATRISGASRRRAFAITFLVAGTAGGVDEIVQRSVPGRVSSLTDWIADLFGAGTGALAMLFSEPVWTPRAGAGVLGPTTRKRR